MVAVAVGGQNALVFFRALQLTNIETIRNVDNKNCFTIWVVESLIHYSMYCCLYTTAIYPTRNCREPAAFCISNPHSQKRYVHLDYGYFLGKSVCGRTVYPVILARQWPAQVHTSNVHVCGWYIVD